MKNLLIAASLFLTIAWIGFIIGVIETGLDVFMCIGFIFYSFWTVVIYKAWQQMKELAFFNEIKKKNEEKKKALGLDK